MLVEYTGEICLCFNSWWRHEMQMRSKYWPVLGGIYLVPVDSPKESQQGYSLTFSLLLASTDSSTNNRVSNDLRHHDVHVTSLQYGRRCILGHIYTYIRSISTWCMFRLFILWSVHTSLTKSFQRENSKCNFYVIFFSCCDAILTLWNILHKCITESENLLLMAYRDGHHY